MKSTEKRRDEAQTFSDIEEKMEKLEKDLEEYKNQTELVEDLFKTDEITAKFNINIKRREVNIIESTVQRAFSFTKELGKIANNMLSKINGLSSKIIQSIAGEIQVPNTAPPVKCILPIIQKLKSTMIMLAKTFYKFIFAKQNVNINLTIH